MEETQKFETWAIVEVMGHNTYIGYCTEQVVAGTAFIRVDVPEVPEKPEERHRSAEPAIPAYTKLIGPGSIYAITPISEEFARAAARQQRAKPHHIYCPELFPPAEEAPKLIAAAVEGQDPFSDE